MRPTSRPIKKTIYTLNIGNYVPGDLRVTYPLIQAYAKKDPRRFPHHPERKFPDWPVVYEKLPRFQRGDKADYISLGNLCQELKFLWLQDVR